MLENDNPLGSNIFFESDKELRELIGLEPRLGIVDPVEQFVFCRYLTYRGFTGSLNGRDQFLQEPIMDSLRTMPVVGRLVRLLESDRDQAIKRDKTIKEQLDEFCDLKYPDEVARERIRLIQMAAFDLASKGLYQGRELKPEHSQQVRADVEDVLEGWGEMWKRKLDEQFSSSEQ